MAETNTGGTPNPTDGQSAGQSGGQQQQQQQTPAGGGQQPLGQQPGAGAGAGGQQPTQYTFKEDRADWVPPHRLSETSRARKTAEEASARFQAELETANKRIAALAGVNPQNPQDKEAEELRGIIGKLYPKLALLDNLDEDTLNEILDAAQVARKSSSATWERHTHGVLTSLDVAAAKVLGVPKLDEKLQGRIRRAFRDEGTQAEQVRTQQLRQGLRETIETIQTDNDFIARFERGDAELVTEFVNDYLNGFIEPVRRSVTADVTRRGLRPVPRGERARTPIVQGQQQEDLNTDAGFKKALLAARGSGASNT